MRVLITGGTGVVGKEITARLVERGYNVRVIGIDAEARIDGAEYSRCDIMDYEHIREQVRGCDAIVHLAAIPNPRQSAGQETFQVNVAGTYNVFEAAAQEGIQRIVQASSINALGCAWSPNEIAPQYLPIDEGHPTFTTDAYSFSKQIIEEIGAYYWRRERIASVALRFPAVLRAEYLHSERFREGRAAMVLRVHPSNFIMSGFTESLLSSLVRAYNS